MDTKNDIFRVLALIGWFILVGNVAKKFKVDEYWVIIALAPIAVFIAYQCWKDDKGSKD